VSLHESAQSWHDINHDSCVFISQRGPCYFNRSILDSQQLPKCIDDKSNIININKEVDVVALQSFKNWFKITDFRRHELQHYISNVLKQPLQILLDGSCSNKLDVVNKWIVIGGNIYRPWIDNILPKNKVKKINTIVMFMSYWEMINKSRQILMIQLIYKYLELYGRFVLIITQW
jgi:hypothetical protein